MDYYTQTSPLHLLQNTEQRKRPRKPMRRQVSVGDTYRGIVRGHTLDMSEDGLSVMLPVALAVNSSCAVRFELFVDGNLVRVAGAGKIVHCSCVGMEGFRVGMRFNVQDPHVQPLLSEFLTR